MYITLLHPAFECSTVLNIQLGLVIDLTNTTCLGSPCWEIASRYQRSRELPLPCLLVCFILKLWPEKPLLLLRLKMVINHHNELNYMLFSFYWLFCFHPLFQCLLNHMKLIILDLNSTFKVFSSSCWIIFFRLVSAFVASQILLYR